MIYILPFLMRFRNGIIDANFPRSFAPMC